MAELLRPFFSRQESGIPTSPNAGAERTKTESQIRTLFPYSSKSRRVKSAKRGCLFFCIEAAQSDNGERFGDVKAEGGRPTHAERPAEGVASPLEAFASCKPEL